MVSRARGQAPSAAMDTKTAELIAESERLLRGDFHGTPKRPGKNGNGHSMGNDSNTEIRGGEARKAAEEVPEPQQVRAEAFNPIRDVGTTSVLGMSAGARSARAGNSNDVASKQTVASGSSATSKGKQKKVKKKGLFSARNRALAIKAELHTNEKELVEEAKLERLEAKGVLKKGATEARRRSIAKVQNATPSHGVDNGTLADREWENELARSIISLYNANSKQKQGMQLEQQRSGISITTSSAGTPKSSAIGSIISPTMMSSNVKRRQLPSLSRKEESSPRKRPAFKRMRQPSHVWFAGSGAVRAVWCSLSDSEFQPDPRMERFDNSRCSHKLCMELRELEQKCKFKEYIDLANERLQEFSRQRTYKTALRSQQMRTQRQQDILGQADNETDKHEDLQADEDCKSGEDGSENGDEEDYVGDLNLNKHTCAIGSQSSAQSDAAVNRKEAARHKRRFMKEMEAAQESYYIDWETVDPSLLSDPQSDIVDRMMWRQLVVCCNVFGVKLTEQHKYGAALVMFKLAEGLLQSTSVIEGGAAFHGNIRTQISGFVWDALAFYYWCRRKPNAAASYAEKAMRAHARLKQWDHVAKCHLHCGAILSMMNKHDEAIKCMAQVLQMVEDERLQIGGTSAQKICLIAVCYHNICVEQLILRRPAEACVSSQNGRRLARLSLTYSNRWINTFERTHQFTLQQLAMRHSYISPDPMSEPTARESLKNPVAKKIYKNIADSIVHQY